MLHWSRWAAYLTDAEPDERLRHDGDHAQERADEGEDDERGEAALDRDLIE